MVNLSENIDSCEFYYKYPVDSHPKLSNMNKGMVYQTHFTKCINNYFAAYTLTSGEIQFYSIKENKLVKENSYQLFVPSFKPNTNNGFGVAYLKDSPMGFLDVVQTNKFVYALYSGKVGGINAYKGNKIYVFTHSGVPVKNYTLDIDIRTFDVNDKGDIYGLSINPVPQLAKFSTI